ncbi:MAG TPA: glycoside hydrolase family 15 protein, partial [Chloroflexota bacterium]
MALTEAKPATGVHAWRQKTPALISEHGLIGDLQTAALVATDGSIDWFCCPRFDSPSVFARILDHERGGFFRIAPVNGDTVVKQLYLPDTALLITRFMSETGVAELVDFMPIAQDPKAVTDNHRIVRLVRGIRGEMHLKLECAPRFDYARARHTVDVTEQGAVFEGAGLKLTLHGMPGLERNGDDVSATRTVRANESFGVVLESAASTPPRPLGYDELWNLLQTTGQFWRDWIGRSTYRGRWREMVDRSAMTLKLMTYAPTGALVAAPTTALPEQLGGERNWDYRFTWVRDASYSVGALNALGYREEATAFMWWLRDRFEEHVGTSSGPLKIMYRVDGSSDLVEESLDHLEGYMGSSPVRIGNGAADQLQLDIYGEAMFALRQAGGERAPIGHRGWTDITVLVDWLVKNWDQPDEGIWETRGGPRKFLYSQLMCWVAMERAIRMANRRGLPANLDRWRRARDEIYRRIMDRDWSAELTAFVQHEGAE